MTAAEWSVYDATVCKAAAIIVDHLQQEEQHVITPLSERMTPMEKQQLAWDWAFGRKTAVTRPHPAAPVVGAKFLHQVTAVLDVATDQFREKLRLRGRPEVADYEEDGYGPALESRGVDPW